MTKQATAIIQHDEIMQRLATAKPPTKLHELTEDERANLLSKMVCVEDLHARNIITEAIWL